MTGDRFNSDNSAGVGNLVATFAGQASREPHKSNNRVAHIIASLAWARKVMRAAAAHQRAKFGDSSAQILPNLGTKGMFETGNQRVLVSKKEDLCSE